MNIRCIEFGAIDVPSQATAQMTAQQMTTEYEAMQIQMITVLQKVVAETMEVWTPANYQTFMNQIKKQ